MAIVSDVQLPKDANGILKVSDVSNSADSNLSARTDIADPTTSTFVKTDATGRLNILESNIEGAGPNNSLNATEFAVSQMGAFDGSAYRVAKCSNVGRLEVDINSGGSSGDASAANQTNGNQKTQIFGIDPSNNQVQLSVENGGKAQVQVVGSNDINGGLPHRHLTIDANGRTLTNPLMSSTNNAIGTTNTLLNAGLPSSLTASGNLKVSIEEGSSGDASASNQTLQLTQATNTNTTLTTLNNKVSSGSDSSLTDAQQVLIYGKNGTGALKPIHITNNGDVEVEISDFVKGQATSANSFPVVISSDQSTLNVKLNDIESGIINPINVASKHENAFLEILTAGSVTSGNNILTSAHTLSAGASSSGMVSPVTIYVHFGAGTSDSNFSVEVHKSYDGTVYFVDTNFTFTPVGSNTNSPPTVEPAVVANGNSDGRFIKVKITNNSESNPTSVDVIVIERQ